MENQVPLSWGDISGLIAESKTMARGLLLKERNSSMRATELVLTALRRQRRTDQTWEEVRWENRKYFFGALYQAMRRALIDHARARRAQKSQRQIELDPAEFARALDRRDIESALDSEPEMVEALMGALDELRGEEPEWAAVVEYRYFSGLTLDETAAMLEVSAKTVQRRWRQARLVLHQRVKERLRHPA